MATSERKPLDVWFKFDDDDDDAPTLEANTFETEDGYVVEWSHVDVGQVSTREFLWYANARSWLENQGFQDFSN